MKLTLQDQTSDQKIKFESFKSDRFDKALLISIWEQDLLVGQVVISDKKALKLYNKLNKHIHGA